MGINIKNIIQYLFEKIAYARKQLYDILSLLFLLNWIFSFYYDSGTFNDIGCSLFYVFSFMVFFFQLISLASLPVFTSVLAEERNQSR